MLPASSKPSAWKPCQTTSGGLLARKASPEAARSTARSTPAMASATSAPGSRPMRQSTSHQAGVLEAQSPPRMIPGLNLIGSSTPAYQRSDAAAAFSSRVCSANAPMRR